MQLDLFSFERIPLHLRNTSVDSRLDRIENWAELAKEASYKPGTMAALAPASLRQLERYFIEKFGKTPRLWAKELQCRMAKELIQLGYSNKATVDALKFTSEAEFCRIFKKVAGFPPQHFSPVYRKRSSPIQKNVA